MTPALMKIYIIFSLVPVMIYFTRKDLILVYAFWYLCIMLLGEKLRRRVAGSERKNPLSLGEKI